MEVFDDSWSFLVVLGFLVVLVSPWWFMVVLGGSCQFLMVLCGSLGFLVVLGGSLWFLAVLGGSFKIFNSYFNFFKNLLYNRGHQC